MPPMMPVQLWRCGRLELSDPPFPNQKRHRDGEEQVLAISVFIGWGCCEAGPAAIPRGADGIASGLRGTESSVTASVTVESFYFGSFY